MLFKRFFSVDSPKAVKAESYGWLNAINYMAPASPRRRRQSLPQCQRWLSRPLLWLIFRQCRALSTRCANRASPRRGSSCTTARLSWTKWSRGSPSSRHGPTSETAPLRALERRDRYRVGKPGRRRSSPRFPDLQFVDYTKSAPGANAPRGSAAIRWPRNYHLTFSRSETNEADCEEVLAAGGNVAVVFAGRCPKATLASLWSTVTSMTCATWTQGPVGCVVAFRLRARRPRRTRAGLWCGHVDRTRTLVRPVDAGEGIPLEAP